jgi:hypothetical protein
MGGGGQRCMGGGEGGGTHLRLHSGLGTRAAPLRVRGREVLPAMDPSIINCSTPPPIHRLSKAMCVACSHRGPTLFSSSAWWLSVLLAHST